MRTMVMHSVAVDLDAPFLFEEEAEDPQVVGPFDVLVEIAGAGVCRTDLEVLRGTLSVETPHILGHENSGRVRAVGDMVRTVSVGDPVVCYPFQADGLSYLERRGIDNGAPHRRTPGLNSPGGFAELLLVNERAVLPLPEGTDLTAAATLTDAGIAAYRAVGKVLDRIRPEATVAVVGVGGLGHIAIQVLAARCSNPVVAIDRREAVRQLSLDCGADAFLLSSDVHSHELGDVGAVIDLVGSADTASLANSLLGFGGHYVVVGVGGELAISTHEVVNRELRIDGVYVGSYPELAELCDLFLRDLVVPRVTRYPLSRAESALRDLNDGLILGRAVLVP
jgi:NAD+-dependent secondary alcohol dehydrogenase Adh1